MKRIEPLLLSFLAVSLLACSEDDMSIQPDSDAATPAIGLQVWQRVASKKIFWGHQSVGFDILEGVDLGGRRIIKKRLQVVDSTDPSVFDGAGALAHAALGSNADPRSKIDAFVDTMEGGMGNTADLAFLKFCYLDFQPGSDVRALFTDYKQAIDALALRYPETTFAHMTVPLTERQTGPKALIKKLMGRPIAGFEDNLKRYQFNLLLKVEYGAKSPIFDLAEIESIHPDGSRETVHVRDNIVPALVPAYTYDGGHLNQLGRQNAARRFLHFLAGID
jgi:hypothetical protein